jgi:hypothetical protein
MKFSIGDSVKLLVKKNYEDGTSIPADTRGIVKNTFPISTTYQVKFSGFSKERRVPEGDLAKA